MDGLVVGKLKFDMIGKMDGTLQKEKNCVVVIGLRFTLAPTLKR